MSRTRQLFPEAVFEALFSKCVEQATIVGHTQAIDSVRVKANATMDSLELKVPVEELGDHLRKVRYMSTPGRVRKSKGSKANTTQQSITTSEQELMALKSRNKKWSEDMDERMDSKNKNSKYTSNKIRYNPTDPDARISVKPGKARKLKYPAQIAVDTAHHKPHFLI